MTKTFAALAVVAATLAGPAMAADVDTVRAFYADILTNPSRATAARYFELFSRDVVSVPTPPGGPGAQGMLNTVAYLGQVVPNLAWAAEEVIATGDGRFVVRGRASGTPIGPFLGVNPPTGKSFTIMSIDIVTVKEGRIAHIYHLEDWTGAIAQLTAP